MSVKTPVTLRYFDCRGRGQFLRYYLKARDIAFSDERVPLSADFAAWATLRGDRAKTGPFQRLPVLEWDRQTVAETLVIAAFLHRANGDQARLSEQDNLRHAMLVSGINSDLMTPLGTLLWADVVMPGVDLAAYTRRVLDRARQYLEIVDRTLSEWRWLEGLRERPLMVADCMLWEELDVAQLVFGEQLQLERHAALNQFYRECPHRAVFERLLAAQPCQVTGRPAEAQALDKLRGILAATSP
jgi:glutathione S-transferase